MVVAAAPGKLVNRTGDNMAIKQASSATSTASAQPAAAPQTLDGIVRPTAGRAEQGYERHLVAFRLGEETYGIDISNIHTIITPQPITSVPRSPSFVRGVMNLRGRVLPVIDLRRRFGMEPMPDENVKSSRIVIVDTPRPNGETGDTLTAGLIVDSVSEVLRLPESAIDPPSQLVASVDTECITGIGKVPAGSRDTVDHLIILLDVYKTLVTCSNDVDSLKRLQG